MGKCKLDQTEQDEVNALARLLYKVGDLKKCLEDYERGNKTTEVDIRSRIDTLKSDIVHTYVQGKPDSTSLERIRDDLRSIHNDICRLRGKIHRRKKNSKGRVCENGNRSSDSQKGESSEGDGSSVAEKERSPMKQKSGQKGDGENEKSNDKMSSKEQNSNEKPPEEGKLSAKESNKNERSSDRKKSWSGKGPDGGKESSSEKKKPSGQEPYGAQQGKSLERKRKELKDQGTNYDEFYVNRARDVSGNSSKQLELLRYPKLIGKEWRYEEPSEVDMTPVRFE